MDSLETASEPTPQPAADSAVSRPPTLAWLGPSLLALAVAGAYHEYLAWMFEQWWKDPYYGHGILIPLVAGYLIWRQRERLAMLPRVGATQGLWVTGAAMLLHLAGLFVGAHFISGFALVATLYGLVIWLWGRPVAQALWFPFVFLLFMVPLARLLVDRLAQPMQLMSAQGAGWLAAWLIGKVKVDGVSLITRDYVFEVAIPCSGLKSLIAMSALGALFAYLVEGPPWKRWLLFVGSAPIALLANLARIVVTLVLGNSLGPAAAEGFFHSVSGAAVFLFGLAGLFLLGRLLGCRHLREGI